jgi:putative cell wall-binding protein
MALWVPTNLTVGGTMRVSAGGFGENEWVIIGISSDPTALGAVQADENGEVTAEVALPPSIEAGPHTLFIINTETGTVSAQPVTVQAPTVPGAPGQPTVVAGNGTGVVDVTFTAPGSDGGATITSYIVTASPGAATCERATAGTCTIVDLVPGTAYTFSVRARNIVGESLASAASDSFTPVARPGSAGGVTATADTTVAGQVTVAWTAAAPNGATVSYVARAVQDPSKSCATASTTASTTCVITGLPNYVALTFEVIATNSVGTGPVSAASSAVTLVPPLPTSPREAEGVIAAPVASGTLASGSSASIVVGDFEPFEWVSIVVQSTPQVLATLQADINGTVTTTVSVPGGLSAGTHYLTVLSDIRPDGTRRGVTQSFTVTSSGGGLPPGGGAPSPGGGTPAPTTFPAERFAGADRYSTSVEISLANFDPGVSVVYLATGANFADALAAGAAAGGAGPVLLVERNRVPLSTLTELGRLRPRRIVVLGGTAAISETVINAVRALATESVTRQGGADRFETAALVSAATFSPNVEVAYVATGANFADALAAGGAARGRGPVLLVRRDGIPDATATELTRLRPRRIVVLGGTAVVAASVQTSLAAYTTGAVSRVGGADRYATAAGLSQSTFAPGVPVVYVATGVNFADALSAAALGAPVLLARPTCLPASTKAELDRLGAERVVVLGGTAALSDDVRRLTVCS